MGKKHKHPEHENLERWLVSYADFITLLFATFVVLYALSQLDIAKFKNVSIGIKDAFRKESIIKGDAGIMPSSNSSSILPNNGNSLMDKSVPSGPHEEELSKVTNKLAQKFAELERADPMSKQRGIELPLLPKGAVEVTVQERGVVVSFASGFMFDSGQAALKPKALQVLDTIGPILAKSGALIRVEGHTDNQPIATEIFPSNWELSGARASTVIRYLIAKHHFDPRRLSAIGYGESRPKLANTTEAGRQRNRRVDIVLLRGEYNPTDARYSEVNQTPVSIKLPEPSAPNQPANLQKTASADIRSQINIAPILSVHSQQDNAKAQMKIIWPGTSGVEQPARPLPIPTPAPPGRATIPMIQPKRTEPPTKP